MQFTLQAQTAGTMPFALGFAFREGDIPAGRQVTASLPNVQCVVKNRWQDGSVKFAVLAGRVVTTAGSNTVVTLQSTANAPAGTALSTADLRATNISASVDAGSLGAAAWAGADWDAPFMPWVSGPEMTSWVYRKPVGADAHLVAWLEVRLFATGAVEVLPWIENGYLNVAGPTNKRAGFSFTMGGTQRFSADIDLPNHCRTPLLSNASLSHWLGSDPGVSVKHDSAYLMDTRLVPTYMAATPANAPAVTSLPATFLPLQQGSYASSMGTAGYHRSIGLLPQWDVLYLTSSASGVWAALQRNAYSAGRYGMHHRDETTNRPLRFSAYPQLCLGSGNGFQGTGSSQTGQRTPNATGTAPATYNSTHCPSMGFMAYLLSGRLYHLETLQFQATAHYLKNGSNERLNAAGVLQTAHGANTVRGAAWATRTLAQAAAISPDGDTLTTEFRSSIASNISWYHSNYAGVATNFGFVAPYSDYTGAGDGVYSDASWQQDFFTAAYGYLKSLKVPLTASDRTRVDEFFAWKARHIVGRLGTAAAGDYLYRDAAVYTLAAAPSDTVAWAGVGPFYANWGQSWSATQAGSAVTKELGDGSLRGGNFPEATSYWGNLQPAIAYAVEHGVPGAADGYARMTSAPNWAGFVRNVNDAPEWGVRPRV